MTIQLVCNSRNPPIGGLAVAELIKATNDVIVEWGSETSITCGSNSTLICKTNNDVLRVLARTAPKFDLYGKTPIEKTQIDHWLTFSLNIYSDLNDKLQYLQKCLGPLTFLVANKLTIADLSVFNELLSKCDNKINDLPNNVQRWYELVKAQDCVVQALKSVPAQTKQSANKQPDKVGERKQEGKFVDLPGAEMGKVVVRFPPEASGYLHIGHAKAALLNQYYQQAFDGKLIMRFDDTNPAKETVEFENVILEDLKMLEIKPDLFTHTSQYFDLMLEYCETLLKESKAYVDDTEPEKMKNEREQKIESTNRNNSVEKNFELWKEMCNSTPLGQKCCVRAKIDMSSPNGCLRDPTIYRCKNEPHPRTGTKYKVYPTYDFACPIVDAIENVTHTLRTMEYHDRDDQFYWFIDALKLRKPYIWEYSRLNMTNTVLSKRKLTWFVENNIVDGWDDPRFPTVRGILRRGMTVQGLREFIIAQGSSKSVVFMEWDKIWAINKKVIDPIAPRYTALEQNTVVVNVTGAKKESIQVPAHPKNAEVGNKTIWLGPRILIDYADAEALKEGENTTFINWGNLMINKINKKDNKIVSIDASLNLENKDFKKTLKLTWLCEMNNDEFPPTYCVYFDHIISKPVLNKDEDFKNFIGHQTLTEVKMVGDPELKKCKKGDIIQLQRRGFFKVDNEYALPSLYTGVTSPVILFEIPDGHTKDKATTGQPAKKATSPPTEVVSTNQCSELNDKITKQGDLVRALKEKKSNKTEIDAAVKILLQLKNEYKKKTGQEWKLETTAINKDNKNVDIAKINELILKQGDLVRTFKSNKAPKPEIDDAVKDLLKYKADFKSATGKDWTPGFNTAVPAVSIANIDTKKVSESCDLKSLNNNIVKQGDLVRKLKSEKAPKCDVDAAVKDLLKYKADYKQTSGQDWKPGTQLSQESSISTSNQIVDATKIDGNICKQGNLVRDLKSKKANKADIDAAVKGLLKYKADYKSATGTDWTPACSQIQPNPSVSTVAKIADSEEVVVLQKIGEQGEKIRNLKSQKSEKSIIDTEVQILLALKGDYKKITGKDWKPGTTASQPMSQIKMVAPESKLCQLTNDDKKNDLTVKINDQGNTVRNLKTNGASKENIDAAVKLLLDLKVEYKNVTGIDFPTPGRASNKSKTEPKQKEKKDLDKSKTKTITKTETESKEDSSGLKKQTRLGLEATKENNLPEWYSQVLTKGELIEYYDVSGCYILRPWSFAIWNTIKTWFTKEITKMGIKEVYFPMFVSKAALEKEKTHIADFSPEVAWVTKSGESDLAEPIAIRPTSETIMYPAFAKWIQSYRDLPLRFNQWSNVVRWEFKHPQPFLRTREFLWQEGHTAFANQKDAEEEVLQILDLYAKIYTDLLAIPVTKGRKTEKEKFAGGDFTTTVEAFVSASGRSIQGATSHHLKQNFSKMFDIIFEDPVTQEKQYAYQNSWGLTTRTIGVMIMVHGDNKGLVLPPRVACIQAIIVPCGITANTTEDERKALMNGCTDLEATLKAADIRVECDFRENYSPGWKFNHWELKGVPIRIELGPKDMKANQFVAVRRDTGEKLTIPRNDVVKRIPALLENIHESMLVRAAQDFQNHLKLAKNWEEFCKHLDQKNVLLSPFCGDMDCEGKIKDDSAVNESDVEVGALTMGAKSLCTPFQQPAEILPADRCIHPACTRKPLSYTLFGRSY